MAAKLIDVWLFIICVTRLVLQLALPQHRDDDAKEERGHGDRAKDAL